jgi:regulation of enolase protein 1 (concanavalin A-like superfamily)
LPEYDDTGVSNGTTYYYIIAAINQSGTNANPAPVSATPSAAGPLPTGWAQQDIGSVTSSGSASYANAGSNTFVLSGNGSDIGGTADSFSFAYVSVTNDFTFTARVLINGSVKVGLMMRETLAANSRALALTVGETGAREMKFWTRSTTGGSMTTQTGNDYSYTPVWVRLKRAGNVFTASQSSDGATWFTIGSSTVAMATNSFVGLAVVGSIATFDNVTTIGSGPALSPTKLAFALAGDQLQFSWPADHTGWQLQAQTNSLGTNWITVAGADLTNQMSVPIGANDGNVFFRLFYP